MRRALLALLAVCAFTSLAMAGTASAYSTGTTYVRYDTTGRPSLVCTSASLTVVGSSASMSYSSCRQTGLIMVSSCATASYTSTLLSSISCVFSTSGAPGTGCNPGARVTGSSPLSGLITVLNSGQSLSATIPNTAACNAVFGLTATDPHTVAAHWGTATDGTGNIPFA